MVWVAYLCLPMYTERFGLSFLCGTGCSKQQLGLVLVQNWRACLCAAVFQALLWASHAEKAWSCASHAQKGYVVQSCSAIVAASAPSCANSGLAGPLGLPFLFGCYSQDRMTGGCHCWGCDEASDSQRSVQRLLGTWRLVSRTAGSCAGQSCVAVLQHGWGCTHCTLWFCDVGGGKRGLDAEDTFMFGCMEKYMYRAPLVSVTYISSLCVCTLLSATRTTFVSLAADALRHHKQHGWL